MTRSVPAHHHGPCSLFRALGTQTKTGVGWREGRREEEGEGREGLASTLPRRVAAPLPSTAHVSQESSREHLLSTYFAYGIVLTPSRGDQSRINALKQSLPSEKVLIWQRRWKLNSREQ